MTKKPKNEVEKIKLVKINDKNLTHIKKGSNTSMLRDNKHAKINYFTRTPKQKERLLELLEPLKKQGMIRYIYNFIGKGDDSVMFTLVKFVDKRPSKEALSAATSKNPNLTQDELKAVATRARLRAFKNKVQYFNWIFHELENIAKSG
jgi:hypothetical protein